MKKLETNYNGGLRLNWDDLRYMQSAFFESINQLCSSLGNQQSIYILSGCETNRWVGHPGGIDIKLSEGVIILSGDIFSFQGFDKSDVPSGSVVWVEKDYSYDPAGVKTDKTFQQEHQTYVEYYAKISYGNEYPSGVENVDYYPLLQKHYTIDIHTLYETLQNNLQKPTENKQCVGLNNWNSYRLKANICGNVMTLYGVIVAPGTPGSTGVAISELPAIMTGTASYYYYFTARYSNAEETNTGTVLCWIRGNKLFVEATEALQEGYKIYIGATVTL